MESHKLMHQQQQLQRVMQAPNVWQGPSALLELPEEALVHIAALLPRNEIKSFRRACRRSRLVANLAVKSAKVREAPVCTMILTLCAENDPFTLHCGHYVRATSYIASYMALPSAESSA